MTIVVKATTKGQITLPISWRKQYKTDHFFVEVKKGMLEIRPLSVDELGKTKEYTVFDAIRDNDGKGIYAKDLAKVIRKTL